MTAHYIDPVNLKRKMGALACRKLKGKHTYDVIAKKHEAIHDEFAIQTKVCSYTADNASNFVKAFDVFRNENADESNTYDWTSEEEYEFPDSTERDELALTEVMS